MFPEALRNKEEFREFARRVKAPLLANMTEFGKTPYIKVQESREAGYKIVIFPVTMFRVAHGAARRALETIKREETQVSPLDAMMTRSEFYVFIGYSEYESRDSKISEHVEELLKSKAKAKT